MMARIEAAEHGADSGRSREWLARAARAPRDPAWVADGVISERWAPISPTTGRLDAFVWKTPPEILMGPEEEDAPAAEAETASLAAAPPAASMGTTPTALPAGTMTPASKPGFLETGAGTAAAPSASPATAPASAIPPAPVPPGTPTERPRRIA